MFNLAGGDVNSIRRFVPGCFQEGELHPCIAKVELMRTIIPTKRGRQLRPELAANVTFRELSLRASCRLFLDPIWQGLRLENRNDETSTCLIYGVSCW